MKRSYEKKRPTRELILQAAMRLFLEEGYHATTSTRIAKELKAQDEAYVLTAREDCFADAFRDCVFFRRYAVKGGNAYISRMQKDLMCSALGAGAARRNNVRFSSLDSEFYV